MGITVTLDSLRTQCRQRADMVNYNFISSTELDGFINEGVREYYDLMTTHYEDEYFHTRAFIDIGSSATVYELPSNFYKMKGVDVRQSANDNRYVSIVPFMFNERNRYAFNANSLPNTTVRIRYVPTVKTLTDTAMTFTDSEVSVANDTINYAGHEFYTGQKITFSTTGTLPSGLSTGTNYWVIRVDEDYFKVASTLSNALETETAIDITAAAGGGTHTINGNKDRMDFINGYETYPIWKAVSMMLEKEESDTSVATNNMDRMRQRIESTGANRDAGMPQRIVDTGNINDREIVLYKETNIRYRVVGDNIEFLYLGYVGI